MCKVHASPVFLIEAGMAKTLRMTLLCAAINAAPYTVIYERFGTFALWLDAAPTDPSAKAR